MKSGRFIRLLSALVAGGLLAVVLYNAIMVDRIPPTYSIRVGTGSSSGLVQTLNSVDVDFSEAVRQDTAEQAFSISPSVDGSFHWQGLKMIFTPSAKLTLSTKFHVHMAAGVQDLVGNAQAGTGDIDFTTIGKPAVTSVSPVVGAKSVAVDTPILVTFDRLMDTQKVIEGISVQPDFAFKATWNGTVLSIAPTRHLQFGTSYTITIGDPAVDTDGTKLTSYATTFTTVDMGLRVAELVPTAGVAGVSIRSQIAVVFDSSIDPSSLNGAIKLTPPVSGSTRAVALPDDRQPSSSPTATPEGSGANVLIFTPDNPLAPHTTYSVALASTVKRTDGQVAAGQSWSFTTGEAPTTALNQVAFISDRSGVDNIWFMNPDGSNQREVTAELAPVAGFDVSGDGLTVAYSAGGVVKKMSVGGDNVQTLTSSGNYEYAPVITPDAGGIVVGRRDGQGADQGYWRYSLVGGTGTTQLTPDGAPGLGSSAPGSLGMNGKPGTSPWTARAAFSGDGSTLLVVRGSDNGMEIVDTKGVNKPIAVSLVGGSQPVWVQDDGAFYVCASDGASVNTWSYYKVTPTGTVTRIGPSLSDMSATGRILAIQVPQSDGSVHLGIVDQAGGQPKLLVDDADYSEMSPSFSPSGAALVFGRVGSSAPGISAGIWTIKPDGTGLVELSPDGVFPDWLP